MTINNNNSICCHAAQGVKVHTATSIGCTCLDSLGSVKTNRANHIFCKAAQGVKARSATSIGCTCLDSLGSVNTNKTYLICCKAAQDVKAILQLLLANVPLTGIFSMTMR
jgi:hypothetical protein